MGKLLPICPSIPFEDLSESRKILMHHFYTKLLEPARMLWKARESFYVYSCGQKGESAELRRTNPRKARKDALNKFKDKLQEGRCGLHSFLSEYRPGVDLFEIVIYFRVPYDATVVFPRTAVLHGIS